MNWRNDVKMLNQFYLMFLCILYSFKSLSCKITQSVPVDKSQEAKSRKFLISVIVNKRLVRQLGVNNNPEVISYNLENGMKKYTQCDNGGVEEFKRS